MVTYRHIPTYLLIALSLPFVQASAETLEQVTAEALRNNPELQLLGESVAGAKGTVRTARTLSNPELTVDPGFRRTREANGKKDEFHVELSLSQLFQFPGKRALEVAIANKNVELSEIALEGFRFQLSSKIARAFYGGMASQKIIESRRQQVESAAALVESARTRANAGYASDFETIKSQADLIAAKKALQQAETEVTNARVTLNTLMGRDPSASLVISGNLDTILRAHREANYLALAMTRNPALRTQFRQAEIAGLTLRSTHLGRRPDFSIGPSLEYLKDEQTYGLSVTVPLPLWDQKQGAIDSAAAGQKRALAELEKTRLEIAAEVTKASLGLQSARKQLALYSPKFLDQLRGLMTQAEESYARNAITLLVYLDAKNTYFDTLIDYYESIDAVIASQAELEAAVGVPLELKP